MPTLLFQAVARGAVERGDGGEHLGIGPTALGDQAAGLGGGLGGGADVRQFGGDALSDASEARFDATAQIAGGRRILALGAGRVAHAREQFVEFAGALAFELGLGLGMRVDQPLPGCRHGRVLGPTVGEQVLPVAAQRGDRRRWVERRHGQLEALGLQMFGDQGAQIIAHLHRRTQHGEGDLADGRRRVGAGGLRGDDLGDALADPRELPLGVVVEVPVEQGWRDEDLDRGGRSGGYGRGFRCDGGSGLGLRAFGGGRRADRDSRGGRGGRREMPAQPGLPRDARRTRRHRHRGGTLALLARLAEVTLITRSTVITRPARIALIPTLRSRGRSSCGSGSGGCRLGLGLLRPHRRDVLLGQFLERPEGGMVGGEAGVHRRFGAQTARRRTAGDQGVDQVDRLLETRKVGVGQRLHRRQPEVRELALEEAGGQAATSTGEEVVDGAGPALRGRGDHGANSL